MRSSGSNSRGTTHSFPELQAWQEHWDTDDGALEPGEVLSDEVGEQLQTTNMQLVSSTGLRALEDFSTAPLSRKGRRQADSTKQPRPAQQSIHSLGLFTAAS